MLDRPFLRELCLEVATLDQAVRPDDRERYVMPDACRLPGSQQVARRCREEREGGRPLERGGIGDIDHHVRTPQDVIEPLSGYRVDAGVRRCGQSVVTLHTKTRNDARSDPTRAPDDDDLHDTLRSVVGRLDRADPWSGPVSSG